MLEIILITVVVIIAFIAISWYNHQRSHERAQAFERELDFDEGRENGPFKQRFDALLGRESQERSKKTTDELETEQTVDFSESQTDWAQQDEVVESTEAEATEVWDMVIAFTIMATESTVFSGRAIKAALEQQDMHFGDMQIFHKYTAGNRKQTLFSVANILAPGTLVPNKFASMTSPGLLLFTRLPGPISEMALFDELLQTAQNMSEQLGGILCDETRQPITEETLEALRSQIFSYQMSMANNQNSNDYLD